MTNKENPSYYSILTADVRYSTDLSCFEKLLYSDITALTNKNGYCNASNKYFSNVFKKSVSSITKSISNLVKHGFLESVLVKNDNNEIIERKLYIVSKITIPIVKNYDTPIVKNDDTPIVKNYEYNNTSNINNINKNKEKNINTKKEVLNLCLVGINDCDNVKITQSEYDKLILDYSTDHVKTQIIQLDGYLEDRPKKYKSHYKALRSWLLKNKPNKSHTVTKPANNYTNGPNLSQRQINNINAVKQAIAETSGVNNAG